MKILTLLTPAVAAVAIFFCPIIAIAQGGYAKISAGYCIGTSYSPGTDRTEKDAERVKLALGKGATATLAGGYMFDPHFGIELGAGYLLGGKSTEHLKHKVYMANSPSDFVEEAEIENFTRMVLFKPAFVVSAGRKGVSPYALFGPEIGKGKIYQHFMGNDPTRIEFRTELKGGIAFGAHGAFGIEVNDETKNSFFMEVTVNSLSYTPQKGEVTKFTVGDIDRLGGMTVRDRETEFNDKIEYNTPPPKDKPAQALKANHPLNSIGLNAGIRFRF